MDFPSSSSNISVSDTTLKRIQELNRIEEGIARVLELASESLSELSKDNPNKQAVTDKSSELFETLKNTEKGLVVQINYLGEVSTSTPHLQSIYGIQRDCSIALEKYNYLRNKIQEVSQLPEKMESVNTESSLLL